MRMVDRLSFNYVVRLSIILFKGLPTISRRRESLIHWLGGAVARQFVTLNFIFHNFFCPFSFVSTLFFVKQLTLESKVDLWWWAPLIANYFIALSVMCRCLSNITWKMSAWARTENYSQSEQRQGDVLLC